MRADSFRLSLSWMIPSYCHRSWPMSSLNIDRPKARTCLWSGQGGQVALSPSASASHRLDIGDQVKAHAKGGQALHQLFFDPLNRQGSSLDPGLLRRDGGSCFS